MEARTCRFGALKARERDFDVPLEEVRGRLELSDRFVQDILREKVYGRNQLGWHSEP